MGLEIVRELSAAELADLLRLSRVRFVVDNAGRLEWVPVEHCYAFWKFEVKPRLVDPARAETGFFLEDFPGNYCYLAYQCNSTAEPVVRLRTFH